MKTLIAVLLLTLTATAAEVRLAWDASPSTNVTYQLYAHTNSFSTTSRSNAVVRLNVGTNLTATVSDLMPATWYFAATANLPGIESDLSNVLVVEVPKPPDRMRTVVLQFSGSLTNFSDVGFFKLRLP